MAAPSPPKAMLRSSMVSVPPLRRTRMPAFTWAQALCWHCACRKADTSSPCRGKCPREVLHVSPSEHGFCFSAPLINHLDPMERDTKDTWHHLRATRLPSPSNEECPAQGPLPLPPLPGPLQERGGSLHPFPLRPGQNGWLLSMCHLSRCLAPESSGPVSPARMEDPPNTSAFLFF